MKELAVLNGSPTFDEDAFPADQIDISNASQSTVQEILQTGELSLFDGTEVQQFETEFANYIETGYAVGMTNCTAALDSALRGVCDPGDEVIIPAYTYNATLMAVLSADCHPRLVDIDPETFVMNTDHLWRVTTEDTSAIVPVHMFGNPVPMDTVVDIATTYDVNIIEDCAQATGAMYAGQQVGSFDIGCHSFGSNKLLRVGEGGAVTTNDESLAQACKVIRHEGEVWTRTETTAAQGPGDELQLSDITEGIDYISSGHNFRMWPLVAALARSRLESFEDATVTPMRQNAAILSEAFSDIDQLKIQQSTDSERVYTSFVVRWRGDQLSRDQLLYIIGKEGIPVGTHFPVAVHETSIWKNNFRVVDFPTASLFCEDHIAFPIYPAIGEHQIHKVATGVRQIIEQVQAQPDTIQDAVDSSFMDAPVTEFFSGVYFNV